MEVPGTLLKRFQLSRWHLSKQHLSWKHLSWQHVSISGMSQLLLAQLWPNFRCRFLGPSLTNATRRGDIVSGNICPQDIFPYQWYLSFYWHSFEQTFWTQFFVTLIFLDQNFFEPKICLNPNFSLFNFSWTQNFSDLEIFGPKFLGPTFFWTYNLSGLINLLTQIFFGLKLFLTKIIFYQTF